MPTLRVSHLIIHGYASLGVPLRDIVSKWKSACMDSRPPKPRPSTSFGMGLEWPTPEVNTRFREASAAGHTSAPLMAAN
ncbi:hypothetical protein SNOG_13649 [Parastagonospora nodorum SN15]|uniref:Uncharacterized protein n=1 Tax=Phaeosphaeria nodorum (strain SN15 / ATCC MYA-4574 / FGSC 10173) TaxID=321614 RepID=Q0U3L5_PHANO|nr:hypothetical protein SNOG_13649 [Parastagonospora nodorum SN15]EAT79096.1 hypothetical protein SNOG_13649 [Parastagonospora nodorum SN15]